VVLYVFTDAFLDIVAQLSDDFKTSNEPITDESLDIYPVKTLIFEYWLLIPEMMWQFNNYNKLLINGFFDDFQMKVKQIITMDKCK